MNDCGDANLEAHRRQAQRFDPHLCPDRCVARHVLAVLSAEIADWQETSLRPGHWYAAASHSRSGLSPSVWYAAAARRSVATEDDRANVMAFIASCSPVRRLPSRAGVPARGGDDEGLNSATALPGNQLLITNDKESWLLLYCRSRIRTGGGCQRVVSASN